MSNASPYHDGDKVHLFLSYFGIFSLIPFFLFKGQRQDPQKDYVYWHACQGLGWVVVAIAVQVVCVVLGIVCGLAGLGFLATILSLVAYVVVLGGMILGWVKAFGGQKFEIPVASNIAGMIRS